jgi:hypothetical protein
MKSLEVATLESNSLEIYLDSGMVAHSKHFKAAAGKGRSSLEE